MSQLFYAYLDSFDEITIIIPKIYYHPNTTFTLNGNDEIIDLRVKEVTSIGDEEKLIASFDAYINLEITYFVVNDNGEKAELFMGKVVRTSLFDSIYYYRKEDLGFTYTKESTKFKIWSPIAKSIVLELISPKGEKRERNLFYKNQGVWRVDELGDLEGYKYRYHVYVNGKYLTTLDPYGIASSANNEYNYVVDLRKFLLMNDYPRKISSALDAVIYETSFRDFTSYFKDDVHHSTYLMFTKSGLRSDKGNPIGFDYLKSLGVTHLQILPFFGFGGVDELHPDSSYNWGYNPVQYNVPSGLYSTDPNDPYTRINELRQTIENIHKAGMFVVMDVVFNHVYDADSFPFEVLCPGYAYMYNREGIKTAYSGCKNDINSSKKMVRKYIIDSILFWAKTYHIDGFRMDIMGLIDFETVNDIALELHDIDPSIILYGEGWKMIQSNTSDSLAHMFNRNVIHSVGFFNDRFRNSVKDYASANDFSIEVVSEVLKGSVSSRFLFKYANQSVNYVECHDDLTLFDDLKKRNPEMTDDEIKKRCLLSTSMVILAIGIPFIHQGQEFYQSKGMISNSYISSDKVNMVDWSRVDENEKDIHFITELINLRKSYPEFHLNTETDVQSDLDLTLTSLNSIVLKYHVASNLIVIFKNTREKEDFKEMDGYEVLTSSVDYLKEEDSLTLMDLGTIILKKE